MVRGKGKLGLRLLGPPVSVNPNPNPNPDHTPNPPLQVPPYQPLFVLEVISAGKGALLYSTNPTPYPYPYPYL